jgi:uncharacterized protein YdaU (DUF1376 family)
MKKRNPYFQFYPADFMNGVRGLSAQEVGVYTMLLCRIYEEDGPVEYHIRRLATYCGMRDATFEKVVETLVDLGKITLSEGRLSNPRAEAEISKRAHGLEIASRAGKISAEKRQQNQQQNATTVEPAFNHTDTDTEVSKSSEAKASGVADAPPPDPDKIMFDAGVALLRSAGKPDGQARSLLGRWRKTYGTEAVISALGKAKREGAIDPVSFIEGVFRHAKRATAATADGSEWWGGRDL